MQLDALSIAFNPDTGSYWVKVEFFPIPGTTQRHCLIWSTYPRPNTLALEEYASQYTERQLHTQRTRSRVIYRILKAIYRDLQAQDMLPGGGYFRRVRLSGEVQSFVVENECRTFGTRYSSNQYRETIEALISNSRNYGERPTRLRKLRAVPAKPEKFKEMWRHYYHQIHIEQNAPECQRYSIEGKGNFRMGVELECITRGKIFGDSAYMYRSEDGSLPDDGSEFITRPDSAEVHVKELGLFLDHNSIRSDNASCGMHVHVDRRMLNNRAIQIIIDRMFDPKRRDFYIRYVAGRNPTRYCRLERGALGDKYCALNTGRSSTIEFRWFSSTNKISVIKRRLRWVNAICAWAMRKASPQAQPELPQQSLRGRAIDRIHDISGCDCEACIEQMMRYLDDDILDPVPF